MPSQPIRIIPRLDVKGPNLLKGIQFEGHRVLGLASDFAATYSRQGADEIFIQDSVASLYQREPQWDELTRIASNVFVPLTFAGGLRSKESARRALRSGADKVGINTAAIHKPSLYAEVSREFGSQCMVCTLDLFFYEKKHTVWTDYGREVSQLTALDWVKQAEDLGVGEIVVSSIDRDGTGEGYDLEIIAKIISSVSVPVIAACGAGTLEHILACAQTGVSGISLASMLHYNTMRPCDRPTLNFDTIGLRKGLEIDSGNIEFLNEGYGSRRDLCVRPTSILEIKNYLRERGIQVTPTVEAQTVVV